MITGRIAADEEHEVCMFHVFEHDRRRACAERRLQPDTARLVAKVAIVARHRRSEEHTSELQSRQYLVCRLLLEKKKKTTRSVRPTIRWQRGVSRRCATRMTLE